MSTDDYLSKRQRLTDAHLCELLGFFTAVLQQGSSLKFDWEGSVPATSRRVRADVVMQLGSLIYSLLALRSRVSATALRLVVGLARRVWPRVDPSELRPDPTIPLDTELPRNACHWLVGEVGDLMLPKPLSEPEDNAHVVEEGRKKAEYAKLLEEYELQMMRKAYEESKEKKGKTNEKKAVSDKDKKIDKKDKKSNEKVDKKDTNAKAENKAVKADAKNKNEAKAKVDPKQETKAKKEEKKPEDKKQEKSQAKPSEKKPEKDEKKEDAKEANVKESTTKAETNEKKSKKAIDKAKGAKSTSVPDDKKKEKKNEKKEIKMAPGPPPSGPFCIVALRQGPSIIPAMPHGWMVTRNFSLSSDSHTTNIYTLWMLGYYRMV
eukprot:845049-Amorphochlora_amoeboformis.AAC.1